jgi:hypothetical protein
MSEGVRRFAYRARPFVALAMMLAVALVEEAGKRW